MSSFGDTLQSLVNEPYENLMQIALDAFAKMTRGMQDKFRNTDTSAVSRTVLTLISVCLGQDGEVTDLECRFLNEMTDSNYNKETLKGVAQIMGGSDGEQILLQLAKVLDTETCAAMALLAACFFAVDETISRKEIAFLEKLMG